MPSAKLSFASSYFKVLVLTAIMMAVGLVVVPPTAQAQSPSCSSLNPFEQVCLDKTASPNPVNVGERLTFRITAYCETIISPGYCFVTGQGNPPITDRLPTGVQYVSATAGGGGATSSCQESSPGVVTCTPEEYQTGDPFVEEIVVIPTQCGTLTNTVSDQYNTASTTFTVNGCPGPPSPPSPPSPPLPPGKHHHHKHHHKHQHKHHGGSGGGGGIIQQ